MRKATLGQPLSQVYIPRALPLGMSSKELVHRIKVTISLGSYDSRLLRL